MRLKRAASLQACEMQAGRLWRAGEVESCLLLEPHPDAAGFDGRIRRHGCAHERHCDAKIIDSQKSDLLYKYIPQVHLAYDSWEMTDIDNMQQSLVAQ